MKRCLTFAILLVLSSIMIGCTHHEIKVRQTDANPGFYYGEIRIPDDRNMGTGSFTTVTKNDALSYFSNNQVISSIMMKRPVFQISVTINPSPRTIAVLLGLADNSNPRSSKIYLFAENMNFTDSHEFEVTFKNWEITGLSMDGVSLRLQQNIGTGTTTY